MFVVLLTQAQVTPRKRKAAKNFTLRLFPYAASNICELFWQEGMADIRFNKGFPNLHYSPAIHTSIVVAHGFSDRFSKSLALDENFKP